MERVRVTCGVESAGLRVAGYGYVTWYAQEDDLLYDGDTENATGASYLRVGDGVRVCHVVHLR